jgi:hypothetical protein
MSTEVKAHLAAGLRGAIDPLPAEAGTTGVGRFQKDRYYQATSGRVVVKESSNAKELCARSGGLFPSPI